MTKPSRIIQALTLIISLVVLNGCQNMVKPQPSASEYLQMAENSQGSERNHYTLKATQSFLDQRALGQAKGLLSNLKTKALQKNNETLYRLLQARYQLFLHQEQQALRQVHALEPSTLPLQQQILAQQILATAYWQLNQWQNSLEAYTQLLQLPMDNNNRERTAENVWHLMLSISIGQLEDANGLSQQAQGWVDLATATREADSSQALANAIAHWRSQHPKHPANVVFAQENQTKAIQARRITLMLPSKGPYKSSATAIRNGFLAAYYVDKKQNPNSPRIQFIDTSSGHIDQLYQQAINNGAQMIVGPLTKTNVDQLARRRLSVPTLALNRLPEKSPKINKLYQFGLSPIDEAQQVATRAFKQNHRKALVIYPKSRWGQNVASAFIAQWHYLGGQLITAQPYTTNAKLKHNIEQALGIDQSEQRKRLLQHSLNKKLRYLPRRRQDIDMVFLVSDSKMARQIRPLLSYYFAGNLPIYATSSIYSASNSARTNQDLNGIIFCDIPWLLRPQQILPELENMQQHIQSLWKINYKQQARLYALGIDAFHLTQSLNQLRRFPNVGLSAASGTLFLTPKQHIYRQLTWAKIKHGQAEQIQ
jgi:outer membrane PBP1 activator LpoA protein